MSVIAFIELGNNKVKKSSFEVASYVSATAKKMGLPAIGIALGSADAAALEALGAYGLEKVVHVNDAALDNFDAKVFAQVLCEAATSVEAQVLVFSHNYSGKGLAPRVAARMKAGLVAGATDLPETDGKQFMVNKTAFSNKGFAKIAINTPVKVVSLSPNSYGSHKGEGTASVEAAAIAVPAASVTVKEKVQLSDKIPLTEADLVVSAGRGLRGPENWGMIEDLADELGAATACSRAVSDVDWRPHHEHVGQTGITISPNLYIAVAISGAIQHLAGVSSSKTIVVINKDPEAPFFKAADYGIVGDAFDVVPKLLTAIKDLRASAN